MPVAGTLIALAPHMPGKEFYRWRVRSFTVLLALDAVERLSHALRPPRVNPSEEQGGLLFGRVVGHNVLEVTDFEFVRSSHRRGAAYDLSPGERTRVGQRVQALRRRQGPGPVGYFRTHLRPGLFLDQSDAALVMETFDESGIMLAIRLNPEGPAEAGIFFQENNDIDCRQAGLKVPFDAEALRILGPIEDFADLNAAADAGRGHRTSVSRKALVSAGVYAAVGAILALATITGMRGREQPGGKVPAPSIVSAAAPESADSTTAPPAVFTDDPRAGDPLDEDPLDNGPLDNDPLDSGAAGTGAPAISGSASPFAPEASDVAAPAAQRGVGKGAAVLRKTGFPAPARAAAVIPPAVPHFPVQPMDKAPLPPILPPPASSPVAGPVPLLEAVATAVPATRAVSVNVSIEPKEQGVLKRAVRRVPAAIGHVPLLGRLPGLRHDSDENVVLAWPEADLSPRIPANVTRHLTGQVEIDVGASIDQNGAAKDIEVVRGDDAQLAFAAEDAVRSARWKPAREGDRNVAMNVVVHYRFAPGPPVPPNASTARTSVSPRASAPRF